MEEVGSIEFVTDEKVKFEVIPRDSSVGSLMEEKGVWFEYNFSTGELTEV